MNSTRSSWPPSRCCPSEPSTTRRARHRARIALETGAAVALFYAGVGWSVFGNEAADLLLTIVFVIGVVNAFNLMDNLDGAASTIALVLAAAIALYATSRGEVALAHSPWP